MNENFSAFFPFHITFKHRIDNKDGIARLIMIGFNILGIF